MCVFCKKSCTKLTRHIERCHKDQEKVKAALKLKKKERVAAFEAFKREGIVAYNRLQSGNANPVYQGQRVLRKYREMKRCNACNAMLSKRFFSYHKHRCIRKNDTHNVFGISLDVDTISSSLKLSPAFTKQIVSKFRCDPIGNVCRKDETILFVGAKQYKKKSVKVSKIGGVTKSIRYMMRTLGNLYLKFKSSDEAILPHGNSLDMFLPENYDLFSEVIENVSVKEDESLKASLRRDIYFTVLNAVKMIRAKYAMKGDAELAAKLERFQLGFVADQDTFLYGARYELEQKRLAKTRKPGSLPLEEDIKVIHDHTLNRMSALLNEFEFWSSQSFIELRNNALTRLTLLNGRRGGETGRLLISEWRDADEDQWIDKQRMDNLSAADKILVNSLKITYMAGKGNRHIVSLLIPEDTVPALRMLADPKAREKAGVSASNAFMFASTQLSEFDASGWHAVKDVCSSLNLQKPELINATKNRHRVSTLYASLDVPEQERKTYS